MKHFGIFFILLFLAGCTTVEFVRKDLKPQKQGVLRHTPPSSPEKEVKYRDEVKKQAGNFCGGEFNITKEYQALGESRSSAGIGTGFGFGSGSGIFVGGSDRPEVMYNYVEFVCR